MSLENASYGDAEGQSDRRDRRGTDVRFANLEKDMADMKHFLFGNGKPGAIDRLFEAQDELRKKQEADNNATRNEMKDGFHSIALTLVEVKNVVGTWKMLGASMASAAVTLLVAYFFVK
jgi:hypothetical protein